MTKFLIVPLLILLSGQAHADFFGGDLPLLAQIVTNTLQTLEQLQTQTGLLQDSMAGIDDQINRIQTISRLIQPSNWSGWKNPADAIARLQTIYETLPRSYHSTKSQVIESEIADAMNLVARMGPEDQTSFESGKELESRGESASPGVAEKLTASGVGTLIAMQAQTQVLQSHITSLLAQMLAEANEKESRSVISNAIGFSTVSQTLNSHNDWFSTHALIHGMGQ